MLPGCGEPRPTRLAQYYLGVERAIKCPLWVESRRSVFSAGHPFQRMVNYRRLPPLLPPETIKSDCALEQLVLLRTGTCSKAALVEAGDESSGTECPAGLFPYQRDTTVALQLEKSRGRTEGQGQRNGQ